MEHLTAGHATGCALLALVPTLLYAALVELFVGHGEATGRVEVLVRVITQPEPRAAGG